MKKAWLIVIILFLGFCFVFIPLDKVKAASLSFSSNSYDGCTFTTAVYATAHQASTGTVESGYIWIGQANALGGQDTIYRGYVIFDTSALPNDATVDSAILSLYVGADQSDTDFNVTIQSGMPTYPHEPVIANDYYYSYYSGSGGSANTSTISGSGYWNITLSAIGEGWISLTGTTKFCLRSSRDISATESTGDEYIECKVAENGASYTAKLYVEYSLPPSYSTITLSASPEVNAEISINGTNYVTPSYASWEDGTVAHLTAEEGVISGGTGYLFDRWYVNSTDTYYDLSIDLTITGDTTIVAYYTEIEDLYYFYGPYDEETGYLLDENVTVSIFYDTLGYPLYEHSFNTSWVFPVSPQALYFRFTFEDNSTREYWIDQTEDVLPVYIFWGENVDDYTINFLDTAGILDDYPYVTAKRYVNGTLHTIEKKKVDAYNSVLMSLVYGRSYTLVLGTEESPYIFGDLTMTESTSVQLVLRTVDFPVNSLLQEDIRIYGVRDNTTITIAYDDDSEETTLVSITIYYGSYEEAYSTTYSNSSFTLTWTGGESDVSYLVQVDINHDTYDELEWRQYFPAMGDMEDLSLDWLGDWDFDSYTLIPSIAILCAAGCFSKVNAYIGMILMCIFAALFTWIGFIPIPAGMLVSAFALAILGGLVYTKTHGGMGQ